MNQSNNNSENNKSMQNNPSMNMSVNNSPSQRENVSTEVENITVESTGASKKFSLNLEAIRDYTILIISFLIVVASIVFLIIPQYGDLSIKQSALVTTETELASITSQREYLENLVGLQDELERNIELAQNALPLDEDEIPYILDQLIQIAEEARVEIDTLSLTGTVDSTGVPRGEPVEIRMQMGINGGYDNIVDFFVRLENARRIVKVNTFQITTRSSTSEDSINQDIYNMTFSLIANFMPDISIDTINIESLSRTPRYEGIINYLASKRFYEPQEIDLNFGIGSPFLPEDVDGIELIDDEEPSDSDEEIEADSGDSDDADGFSGISQ